MTPTIIKTAKESRHPGQWRPEAGQRPGPRIGCRGVRCRAGAVYVRRVPTRSPAGFLGHGQGPLSRARQLYADVSVPGGIGLELRARLRLVPCLPGRLTLAGHVETLGTVNPEHGLTGQVRSLGAVRARALVELGRRRYMIDLRLAFWSLSVSSTVQRGSRRSGGRCSAHGVSALEFPYLRGPDLPSALNALAHIDDPCAARQAGARFRLPFGAVPVVLTWAYRPRLGRLSSEGEDGGDQQGS